MMGQAKVTPEFGSGHVGEVGRVMNLGLLASILIHDKCLGSPGWGRGRELLNNTTELHRIAAALCQDNLGCFCCWVLSLPGYPFLHSGSTLDVSCSFLVLPLRIIVSLRVGG